MNTPTDIYHLMQYSMFLIPYHFFFFNDTPTTEIYTLSLHDALPIWETRSPTPAAWRAWGSSPGDGYPPAWLLPQARDRKSTRLNSSHVKISYAVFCLKKKKRTHKSRNAPP